VSRSQASMTRVDLVQQRLHQVRLGVAQIVKDGLGLPPYPACRHLIADGAVGAADTPEHAGPLVGALVLAEQPQRLLVARHGILVMVQLSMGIAEAVPGCGLPEAVPVSRWMASACSQQATACAKSAWWEQYHPTAFRERAIPTGGPGRDICPARAGLKPAPGRSRPEARRSVRCRAGTAPRQWGCRSPGRHDRLRTPQPEVDCPVRIQIRTTAPRL
jgi:hypothetical protein